MPDPLFKIVDGATVEMSAEEEAVTRAEWATAAADAPRRRTLAKIAELEGAVSLRRLREAVLTDKGKAWLAAREAEIATERAKL